MGKTVDLYGFPKTVLAEDVKKFLEGITGQGSVYALDVKQSKAGPRTNVRVQFTKPRFAEHLVALANRIPRLYYGLSFLKARLMEYDMVPRPRTYEHHMEGIVLNFGCQVSGVKFSVLWKTRDVSVKFGIGLKKMYFHICKDCVEYKLELAYENIWQIVLHSASDQVARSLLIQLFGAPRIFRKLDDSRFSYFNETPDDQWARTTDFTSYFCIGQSSGICLQIPDDVILPKFGDYFPWYKEESESQFILKYGSPYSSNSALVPIVCPPREFELPYGVLFRICYLVQNGCLPGPSLDYDFFRLVDPTRIDIKLIEHSLEDLYNLKECCYNPVKWLSEQYRESVRLKKVPKSPTITLDGGLVYVRRVQVTPCKVYFCGPEVNVSNRVLRNYPGDIDNFLRVSFIDEEWNKLSSIHLMSRGFGCKKRTEIFDRVLSTLNKGIVIGNKKFDFLAFSSSQLRENSAWMFASRPGLTAADIRAWMGDFHNIKNVAKYAARLGQSFSSSTETLTVLKHEVDIIPDIEIKGANKYVFSDGIGKISAEFASKVAKKCDLKHFSPSAFQIRYGGYKGVVAVDPDSSFKLSLRPSMLKYESVNNKLDVLAWCKYQPCFLNRQLITLLSTLGVNDIVFEKKQRKAVAELDLMLTDPIKAHEALELMVPGENTNILKQMLKCGYKPDSEPFLSMMLQTFRASKLLDLRLKSRIFIPKGRSLMGCLDETGILEYGQVYVQVSNAGQGHLYEEDSFSYSNNARDYTSILSGMVVVAKNPCLHPGDIRVLKAVHVPALNHMVDCVVFPQKGPRPHPNECSGSDLDGDIYFVCWDPDLIPPRQEAPMDYTPAPTVELDHEVTIEEVEEYFTNYIVNDSLGIIANAHTVFADREPLKAMGKPCLELAKLFSIAVDFPKTGVPAEIPPELRVKEYPDFMEKPDKPGYESQNVIGKLFREVKNIVPSSIESFTKERVTRSYDPDLIVTGFEEYIDEAYDYKAEYDYKLGNLMEYYGIKTEAELLSGGMLKMSKSFDRRKDAEAVGGAVRSLRKEARTWFKKDSESDNLYAKASAWYHVTYHRSFWGVYNKEFKRDHYISFPWCIYDKLIEIKKQKRPNGVLTRARARANNVSVRANVNASAPDVSSLEQQLRDLRLRHS